MKQRSLMKVATPLMIGRGISAILTFTIPIVLARHLAQHDYGTYKQYFLLANTSYLIGQLGLTASLYYFLPRAETERGRILVQTLLQLLGIGVIFGVGLLALGHFISARFSNPQLAPLIAPLALYVIAFLGAAPLEISLTSTKRTGWAGALYVVSDLTRTFALAAPIYYGRGVALLAWTAAGFATLRLLAAWGLALSGVIGQPLLPTRKSLRTQLAYSLPFGGAVLLATAQMQLPQYLVAGLTNAATYAIYAVGILQIPVTDMLYTPVAEVMMVRLAATPPSGAPAVFREAIARLVLFFVPLCAFLVAVAPELVPTLYTKRYLASVPIFMIALLEVPLSALPVDGLLRSLDATRTIFWINGIRLAFTVLAVPLGLAALGLPGAMLGYVTTQWLAKMMLAFAASRRLGVRVRELFPAREIGSWTARSAALGASVYALRKLAPWHGVRFLVAAGFLATIIWIVSLLSARELRAPAGKADESSEAEATFV
jgi:O-antigen/teichoic acid export membrane protein